MGNIRSVGLGYGKAFTTWDRERSARKPNRVIAILQFTLWLSKLEEIALWKLATFRAHPGRSTQSCAEEEQA